MSDQRQYELLGAALLAKVAIVLMCAIGFWAAAAALAHPGSWRLQEYGLFGDSMAPLAVVVTSATLMLAIWERLESRRTGEAALEAIVSLARAQADLARAQEIANDVRLLEGVRDEVADLLGLATRLAGYAGFLRKNGEWMLAHAASTMAGKSVVPDTLVKIEIPQLQAIQEEVEVWIQRMPVETTEERRERREMWEGHRRHALQATRRTLHDLKMSLQAVEAERKPLPRERF